MPLNFPSTEHKQLGNPPLREVVCQVHFPVVLKIAEGIPADFQDRVRNRFPDYETEQALLVESIPGKAVRPAGIKPPVHRFRNLEASDMVSLAVDNYSVSTNDYQSWNDLAANIQMATDAVLDVYQIQYAMRIGLRYINVFDEETTGLKNLVPDILSIFRPELTQLISMGVFDSPHQGMTHILSNYEDGVFSFRSGIIQNQETQNSVFVLDFDCYTEGRVELNTEHLLQLCDHYHATIYNAFRWSIKEDKLNLFK